MQLGHAEIEINEKNLIKSRLKKEIVNLIENQGVTAFYNGGKGQFDLLCAECINELKNDYPFIRSYLILAYIPGKRSQFGIDFYKRFDDIIYPEIEKTPLKFAVIKRNEWVINKSDFLIAYVEHNWGGAYKTLEYAKRKKHIQIINIAN